MTPSLLLATLLCCPASAGTLPSTVAVAPAPLAPLVLGARDDTGFQRFVVDTRQSEVGFDGTSTLHDFVGRTRELRGELHVDPERLESTAGGQLSIAVTSLDTDSDGRDEEMLETLQADRYPEIVLSVDSLAGALDGWRGRLLARVTFLIHGIGRQRTLPVTFSPMGRTGFHVTGELSFSIEDHGLQPPGFLFVSMDESVKVWFDVALRPLPAPRLPARRIPLTLRQTQQQGEHPATVLESDDVLIVHGEQLIWDRRAAARWWQNTPAGVVVLALDAATRQPAPPPAEVAFAALDRRLAERQASATDDPRDEQALRELQRLTRFAPPPGEASLERDGDTLRVLLGGQLWAQLDGLHDEAPFGELLGSLPGVPATVRSALAGVAGLPGSFSLRTVTPEGSSEWQGRLGETSDVHTPDWYWTPESWTELQLVHDGRQSQRSASLGGAGQ